MFPIPFNFPFRKKDGSITTMDDAISSGGGSYTLPTASANVKGGVKIGNGLTMTGEVLSANEQVPSYSESESGKVLTVNASGELEWDTSGSGGGDSMMSWDFTKYGNITRHGVTFSSNGATFHTMADYIILFGELDGTTRTPYNDFTIYVDIDTMNLTASELHKRFIMATYDCGFIYRSTGAWAFYSNEWEDSEIEDINFFSNSKLKIYVDSSSKWHIYKNNVLVFEPTIARTVPNLSIGSTSNSINAGVIKSVRMYSGDYTET